MPRSRTLGKRNKIFFSRKESEKKLKKNFAECPDLGNSAKDKIYLIPSLQKGGEVSRANDVRGPWAKWPAPIGCCDVVGSWSLGAFGAASSLLKALVWF